MWASRLAGGSSSEPGSNGGRPPLAAHDWSTGSTDVSNVAKSTTMDRGTVTMSPWTSPYGIENHVEAPRRSTVPPTGRDSARVGASPGRLIVTDAGDSNPGADRIDWSRSTPLLRSPATTWIHGCCARYAGFTANSRAVTWAPLPGSRTTFVAANGSTLATPGTAARLLLSAAKSGASGLGTARMSALSGASAVRVI